MKRLREHVRLDWSREAGCYIYLKSGRKYRERVTVKLESLRNTTPIFLFLVSPELFDHLVARIKVTYLGQANCIALRAQTLD